MLLFQSFKNKKSKAHQSLHLTQLVTDDDGPIIADTSDTESEPGTWYWNASVSSLPFQDGSLS